MAKYVLGPNAARKIRQLMDGAGRVSERTALGHPLALESEFADPFAVRWAQSVNEGKGSWIIWLPSGHLVLADGKTLDPTKELEAAQGGYPEGWYLLPNETLSADVGGTLYLAVTMPDDSEGGAEGGCVFRSGTEDEGEDKSGGLVYKVAICAAAVDEVSGARSVKQYVTSSIIIGSGTGEAFVYFADEKSVSRKASGGAQDFRSTNVFFLKGFGRFSSNDRDDGASNPGAVGVFAPSSDAEFDPESGEGPENLSFLCRQGDSDEVDANELVYKKISFGSGGASSPFKHVTVREKDPAEGGEMVTKHKIVHCTFYWHGRAVELGDYDCSAASMGGSVFLCGTQPEPSASNPEPEWNWQLSTSEQAGSASGNSLCFKLYDFSDGKVAVDYRTTFLVVDDPTTRARIEVKRPNGNGSIVLDASGDEPKIVITDGNGKSITLDVGDIPDTGYCPSGHIGIHELKYRSKDNPNPDDVTVHHVLGCSDIDLSKILSDGKTIKDVQIEPKSNETVLKFIYTDDTETEIHIPHGKGGTPGPPGPPGDSPEITSVRMNNKIIIYADGAQIAELQDGKTPSITAERAGKTVTIFADGVPIATINDGEDGKDAEGGGSGGGGGEIQYVEMNVIVDVKYDYLNHRLMPTYKKVRVLASSDPDDASLNTMPIFTATPLQ